jgi:hypothetical protein
MHGIMEIVNDDDSQTRFHCMSITLIPVAKQVGTCTMGIPLGHT